jgi:hypothetical protein
MAGCCEHGDELSGAVIGKGFLDQLSDYYTVMNCMQLVYFHQ